MNNVVASDLPSAPQTATKKISGKVQAKGLNKKIEPDFMTRNNILGTASPPFKKTKLDDRQSITLSPNFLVEEYADSSSAQPNQYESFQSHDTQGIEWALAKSSLMGTTDAKSTGPALAKAASNELAEHCLGRAPDSSDSRSCKEEKAARLIQHKVTQYLDKKSLLKYYRVFGFPKESPDTAHNILKEYSRANLEKIKSELGPLSKDENKILQRIEAIGVRFRHQTCIDLNDERLCMLSSDTRNTKSSPFPHLAYLGGFLFFAVEFSSKFSNETPLKTEHDGIDYGPIAYFLDEKEVNNRPCFITLSNIKNNHVKKTNIHSEINPYPPERYPENRYHELYSSQIIFTPDDCRSGIALYLIKDLRSRKKLYPDYVKKITTLINQDTNENNNTQKVLNSLMEPEAHIPRVLRTNNYQKTMHRSYNIDECVDHEKINELIELLTDTDQCIKVLAEMLLEHGEKEFMKPVFDKIYELIGRLTDKDQCIKILAKILDGKYAKNECIMKPVFDKIFSMVSRQDLPEIKKAYAAISEWSKPDIPADLAKHLCYEWNKENRELLLKHGIIRLSDL